MRRSPGCSPSGAAAGCTTRPPTLRQSVVNEATSRARRRVLEVREERRRSGHGRGAGQLDEQVAEQDVVVQGVRLPVRQRAVLVLRYYDGLPEADVADILGVSVGAVKSRCGTGPRTPS